MSVQRVAIVEHQLLFARALGTIFSDDPELDVVGEFRAPSQAELAACAPTIVVLDIDGQGGDVARTIGMCLEIASHPQVCVLSGQASADTMQRCLGAGAAAYVVKDVVPADVINALKIVARGHSYVDPRLAGTLLRGRSRGNEKRPATELSLRETEILKLIAEGFANKQISSRLGLSEKTVKNHISRIFSKLKITARTQAAVHAIREGIV
jgi:DNA-binding NarL/FixJ family response regulator